jgi:hypothetical protein
VHRTHYSSGAIQANFLLTICFKLAKLKVERRSDSCVYSPRYGISETVIALEISSLFCFEKVKPPSETWIYLELRSSGHRFKCPLYLLMAGIFLA